MPVLLIMARTVIGQAGEIRDLIVRVAVIAEEFMCEQKDLRLLLLRQFAHLSPGQAEPERGPLMKRELIAGDVVRREGDRLLQSTLPDLERLARQAIDQIDRNRIESRRAGGLHTAPGSLGIVPPSQEFQGVRVEGLNPERQETDVEIAPSPDALGIDVLRIGLEGDPGAILDRKIFAD